MDLKADLTNSWMNDPRYLGQIGHFLGATSIMLLTAYLSPHVWIIWLIAGLFTLYAALKEFWYDANYELPKQTWRDNLLDFGFYMLGIVFTLIIVFVVKPHIH